MREYVKEYQKMRENHFRDWGYYSNPINLREFEKSNQKIFEKYLKNSKVMSDDILRIKLYSSLLLDDIKYFAYYIAFSYRDYNQLNNALWQTGREELIRGGLLAS